MARPKHLLSHADTSNTQVVCGPCIDHKHNKCNGWAVKKLIKCMCKDLLDHKE